jgi:polar amino acid transport system permease protein
MGWEFKNPSHPIFNQVYFRIGAIMQSVQENIHRSRRLTGEFVPSKFPWWALALISVGLFLTYQILSSTNYRETFSFLLLGVGVTLRMTLVAFPIATILGLITGIGRTSKNVFFHNIATLYVETIRGIPLIVIILYFAFGILPVFVELTNQIGVWGIERMPQGFLWNFFNGLTTFSIRRVSYELRAIIALSIGYGAFEAEIFRAGIQSIGKGQIEAARSLGMSHIQSLRYIILPQAVRRVLPPLGNDFIALLKDTSLATVIAVPELTQMGRIRRASTFRVLETYNVIAYLYLAMTLMLSAGVQALERYLKYEE